MNKLYVFLGAIILFGAAAIWTQRRDAAPSAQPVSVVADVGFEGYVAGSNSAPVEIVEYADFQCPACARHAILTMPDVMQRMVNTGQVRWRFRDFPLDQIHPKSRSAHLAAACADEQGKFWEMHDQLFYGQNDWVNTRRHERRFRDYARTVGLDLDQYNECMSSQRYAGRVQAAQQEGFEAGVGSTPSFVIGGRLYSGVLAYDELRVIVDSLLAQ
ncbi:MAG: DsbA family protein [Gemmatimonadales bacterium]